MSAVKFVSALLAMRLHSFPVSSTRFAVGCENPGDAK